MNRVTDHQAKALLQKDAKKISNLIENQRHLCVACPAFEEVIDTHLFGFSKKIEFAIEMGMIEEEEGHLMMSELEKYLNDVYHQALECQE